MEAPKINFTPIILIVLLMAFASLALSFYMGMKTQEYYYPPCAPGINKKIGYTVIDSGTILVDGDTIRKDWRIKYLKP